MEEKEIENKPEIEKKEVKEIKEEKKPVLESTSKEEFTLSGNKEVTHNQQSQPSLVNQKKEEPKQESPKKEEIIKEEKSEKEEREKYENRRNMEMPSQPQWTYMMMCPCSNNPNDKPPLMFMIPMYCVDPRNYPNGIPMPTIPPMTNFQFPFFAYPSYGMNMQNNMQNK